ncbi:MAG: hypothetical protein EDM03_01925 [Porphyrobacter sp. IPPAS B-1204]|nr:MAG: hypothetical protein EDM03_01925 [Porphyrobacter sp. IPPAS B-1204]
MVLSFEPPANEPSLLLGAIGFGSIILVAAVVSWLAARYLAWAMAPRRFWLRVAIAGALPVSIIIGVFVAVDLSRGHDILSAVARLGRVTLIGQLLMLALLLTGMGTSWLTALRRRRRDLGRAHAAYEIFQ